MELWLTLIALYAWQCILWLSLPGAVFGPRWLGADDLRRAGPQWLSPWPTTLGVVAAPLPFDLSPDARSVVVHTGASTGPPHVLDLDGLGLDGPGLERRQAKLRAGGQTIAKAASKAQAGIWYLALASLAAAPPPERATRFDAFVARSLDAEALRARLGEARDATRWLGRICDLQLLLTFFAVPAVGAVLGGEFALAVSWPALGAVHVFALVLAFIAHRQLFPERGGERFEELFMAALYPPALLRRPQAWIDAAAAGHHPLAWVQVLAPEPEARPIWLRACARLERQAVRDDTRADGARREHAMVLSAMPEAWRDNAMRARTDPTAESYCPVCWNDYRSGFPHCASCDAETIAYAQTSA